MPADPARLVVNTTEPGRYELIGEVDAYTVTLLSEDALALPTTAGMHVSFDMSKVDFMDSSGLRALIELTDRARAVGMSVVVRSPSRTVARLIEISGLGEIIEVDAD